MALRTTFSRCGLGQRLRRCRPDAGRTAIASPPRNERPVVGCLKLHKTIGSFQAELVRN